MSDSDDQTVTAELMDEDSAIGGKVDEKTGMLVVPAGEAFPTRLVLLPLSNRPLFPGLVVPLIYENDILIRQIENLSKAGQTHVGLVLSKEDNGDNSADNLYSVGVVARIIKVQTIPDQGLHLIVECLERFEIDKVIKNEFPVAVVPRYHKETSYQDNLELRAYTVAIINTIKELLKHNPLYEEELKMFLSRFSSDEPNRLADFAASLTTAAPEELQSVLEIFPIYERLKKVMTLLNRELNVSKIQSRIRQNIEERVSEQQRQFFLKEELKEIKRELGMESDERLQEVNRFRKRLKSLTLSEEAGKVVEDELQKLALLEPSSPEYSVSRNYLDWLTVLPWGKSGKDRLSLPAAEKVLNRNHSGLKEVKERILEFIAVGARRKSIGGSIILFVGPPGVGKTSLGKTIAEAVNRPFFRFSVGGMRDEAEIKGHRRTYIGSMPGKLIQAMKQVGKSNPVVMIDEVDKIGSDFRGDPASALLEVLDPEQNKDFLDHYLDVRFNLSEVLFLLTANQLDSIPAPLRDRAEIIRLPGYITHEKLDIAKKHLWPKLMKAVGLSSKEVRVSLSGFENLIEGYAREPGVRRLEQMLRKILRKVAVKLEQGEKTPIRIGARNLSDFLGKPRFRSETLRTGVGIATGLAWTSMGGVTLPVEATVVHRDRRGLKLTGHLGKVMQESAEAAYSYVVSNGGRYGVKDDFFDKAFVHLHVPEGAVPKDGPSAGITMATALLSLALNKSPKPVAMTGEMTLTGEVLAIGGVREKLLAAKRLGIDEVIVPEENRIDVEELPKEVVEGIEINYASHFKQVASRMLGVRLRSAK